MEGKRDEWSDLAMSLPDHGMSLLRAGVELRFHSHTRQNGLLSLSFPFHLSASDPFSLSLYPLILERKPMKRLSVNAASSVMTQQIGYSFLQR